MSTRQMIIYFFFKIKYYKRVIAFVYNDLTSSHGMDQNHVNFYFIYELTSQAIKYVDLLDSCTCCLSK